MDRAGSSNVARGCTPKVQLQSMKKEFGESINAKRFPEKDAEHSSVVKEEQHDYGQLCVWHSLSASSLSCTDCWLLIRTV